MEAKVVNKMKYEESIKKYHKQNEELKVQKASHAMKSEKIKEKIAHDQEKMNKLSGDVNAITTESQMVIYIIDRNIFQVMNNKFQHF